MVKYIGTVEDVNLAPWFALDSIYVFDTIREAEQVIRDAGSWRHYVNVLGTDTGAMLLSSPTVHLYAVPADSTALITANSLLRDDSFYCQPDVQIEAGPRGGVTRIW